MAMMEIQLLGVAWRSYRNFLMTKNGHYLKSFLKKRVDYSSLSNRYPEWDVFSDEKKYHLVQQNFIYSRLAPKMRQLKPVQFYRLYRQISKVFDIDLSIFCKKQP